MNHLFLLALLIAGVSRGTDVQPQLLVKAADHPWLTPIYSPDTNSLAFTTPEMNKIWSFDLVSGLGPSRVATGDSIGRRFLFDPNRKDDRVVYRVRINALPQKPVRLLSASIHVFDPITLAPTMGEILGPYLFANQICYRLSLTEPLIGVRDSVGLAGPYLDRETHRFWAQDASGLRIFESPETERVGGFELSPDGLYAAVVATLPDPILYLVELKNGTRHDLGVGRWPSWSADSRKLVCLTEIMNRNTIRVHDVASLEHKAVELPDTFKPEDPALNSDGSRIVFVHEGSIYQISAP